MGSEDEVGADPPPGVGRRCFVTNGEGGTEAAHPSGQRIEGHPSLGRGLGCPRCPILPWGRVPSTALVPGMLHRPDQHDKAPIATQLQRRRSTPSVASANNSVEHHTATAPWGSPISSRDTGTQLRSTNLSRAPGRWPPEPAFAGRAVFGGLSLLFFFFHDSALHYIL